MKLGTSQCALLTVKLAVALAMISLTASIQCRSQIVGATTKTGCVRLVGNSPKLAVSGKLTVQLFAGPPNFESIAGGDAEERAFILELPKSACLDDGGKFADPKTRFDRVHVSSTNHALIKVLDAAIGRMVTVSGVGLAADNGHHHAPLVLFAEKVTVQ